MLCHHGQHSPCHRVLLVPSQSIILVTVSRKGRNMSRISRRCAPRSSTSINQRVLSFYSFKLCCAWRMNAAHSMDLLIQKRMATTCKVGWHWAAGLVF